MWKDLDNFKNDVKGIQRYFAKWKTIIRFLPSKPNYKGLYVSGEFQHFKRKQLWEGQSTLFIHTEEFDVLEFTKNSWNKLKFKLIQTLLHELVHYFQNYSSYSSFDSYARYKKVGNASIDEDRKYYSEKTEIQAHAHCIWLDYMLLKNKYSISTLIKRCKKRNDSETFTKILKTFNYNFSDNNTLRYLIDHIFRWDRKYSKKFATI